MNFKFRKWCNTKDAEAGLVSTSFVLVKLVILKPLHGFCYEAFMKILKMQTISWTGSGLREQGFSVDQVTMGKAM